MVRNKYKLRLMRESGRISAQALKKTLDNIKVGVTGEKLNDIVQNSITSLGGYPSFKTVPGYKWASCITINEQVVHGIPTGRIIKQGDLVSIDLGVVRKGWHTDCAWTVLVDGGEERLEKEKFLKVGEEALWDGINQAVDGGRIGDISHAIQARVEGAGLYTVRSLVGHGVGRSLHEEPEVPGYGKKGTGPSLNEGMTLAIEVIYAKGTSDVILGSDGWTVSTLDKSWAGLYEMTIVVGKREAQVLTDWRHP